MKILAIICALLIPLAAAADIKHENICDTEKIKADPICKAVGGTVYIKHADGSLEYWSTVIGIAKLNKGDVIYKGKTAPADEYYFMCKTDPDQEKYILKARSAENIIVVPKYIPVMKK